MSDINYKDNNTEDIMENYSETDDIINPTYPMSYCPLCRYSMPMADEYAEYDDPYEYEYDEEDDWDPGYRQRRPRRRRRRRRRPYYPHPYYYPRPYYPRPYYPRPHYPRPYHPPYHRSIYECECDED